jgi:hypothetical protein
MLEMGLVGARGGHVRSFELEVFRKDRSRIWISAHPGAKEKVPLALNHAIQSTITVARNEWKYVADVETEFDASLPPTSCLRVSSTR